MALSINAHHFAAPSSNVGIMIDLVECLCGEHATVPSETDWVVIDSWDGTTRTQPTSGNLADCANAWVPGGTVPPNNSWIVLQSQPANVSAVCQVRFKVDTGGSSIYLMPFADWTPGGGTGSSPTIPSRTSSAFSLDLSTGTASRSIAWDEGCFASVSMNSSDATQKQFYCGELNAFISESVDERPFVIGNNTSGWNAVSNWWRISPVDDTTVLSTGTTLNGASDDFAAWPLGVNLIPIIVVFGASSHQHCAGALRHSAMGPSFTASTKATCGLSLGVRDWALWRTSGQLNASMIRHDGSTLSTDVLRLNTPYDIEPPTGYALARTKPLLVRVR